MGKNQIDINYVRRRLASVFFDIAMWLDEPQMVEWCCEIACDHDHGYCPDCGSERWYCR